MCISDVAMRCSPYWPPQIQASMYSAIMMHASHMHEMREYFVFKIDSHSLHPLCSIRQPGMPPSLHCGRRSPHRRALFRSAPNKNMEFLSHQQYCTQHIASFSIHNDDGVTDATMLSYALSPMISMISLNHCSLSTHSRNKNAFGSAIHRPHATPSVASPHDERHPLRTHFPVVACLTTKSTTSKISI